MTPAEFTKEYASVLQKAQPAAQIKIKAPLELKITGTSGIELTAFLDNCFKEYSTSPQNKAVIIDRYVAAFAEEPNFNRETINLSRIVPIIKDYGWLEEVKKGIAAAGGKDWPESVYDILNDKLVIVYAEDTEKNLRFLSQKDMNKIPIKREELRTLATDNLRRLLGSTIDIRSGNGKYMITAGGTFEASLILMNELWNGDKFKVDGDIVIAIPSRDVLLVTGSKNKEALATLKSLANQVVANASYRLTNELFVYRSGKFEKFTD